MRTLRHTTDLRFQMSDIRYRFQISDIRYQKGKASVIFGLVLCLTGFAGQLYSLGSRCSVVVMSPVNYGALVVVASGCEDT